MLVQRSIHPQDLAPGDAKSADFDWRGFEFQEVDDPGDPGFPEIYHALAEIFQPLGEMETAENLLRRLDLKNGPQTKDHYFSYRMMALKKQGRLAAVRDHSSIVSMQPAPALYVHLSHAWVAPEWRRTGIAGWLRAFPVADARRCLETIGLAEDTPINLVAEMEPLEVDEQLPRLAAYARAGFRRVDPKQVDYFQPDFRPPQEIDLGGGPRPLPFWLMLRQVGREDQRAMRGDELRRLVAALYALYGAGFRAEDMQPLHLQLEMDYPMASARISLEQFDPAKQHSSV